MFPLPEGVPRLRPTVLLLVFVLSVAPGLGQGAEPERDAELVEIPAVSLDAAEEAVRSQIEEQRAALEAARDGADLPSRELGRAYGEMGQLYLLYDLTAAAEASLANATRLDAESYRWHYLLGTLHELDGRVGDAIRSYRRALELVQGAAALPVRTRLARSLIDTDGLDEAQRLFEDLAQHEAYRAVALDGLGRVAAARGNHEEAAGHFSAALAAQPTANQIHYRLALARRELGDLERAKYHLANRGDVEVTHPDPVVLDLQSQVRGSAAMLTLGRISLATGELDVAEERFRRAVEIAPDSAAAQRALGNLLLRTGRLSPALAAYREALEADPDGTGLRYFVARLLLDPVATAGRSLELDADDRTPETRGRRLQEAIGHLRTILLTSPDFLGARLDLAEALATGGRFEEAEEVFLEALERHPDSFDIHYLRAATLADRIAALAGTPGADIEAWGAAGREAVARFLEGLEQADRSLAAAAELDLGVLQLRLGDSEPGRRRLWGLLANGNVEEGIRAVAALHLGNEAAQRRDDEVALDHFREATRLDPALGEARFNLATLLGRMGRYAEAAEVHDGLVEREPDNQAARFSHAMALVLAGEYGAARASLEASLERFPSAPAFAHLLVRILVASPDDAVRDAEVGLDLAFRLFDALPTPEHAETVAMALAEAGSFDKAVEWQERVLEELAENAPGRETASKRLDRYRALQPVRSPWADP